MTSRSRGSDGGSDRGRGRGRGGGGFKHTDRDLSRVRDEDAFKVTARGGAIGSRHFDKPDKVETFRHQAYQAHRSAQQAVQSLYLGLPPADRKLIGARMVIPGKDQIPSGLDNPHTLDNIRLKHQVWIANIEPHIFDIQSETMPRLQAAVKAINWALHDMRLSNEHPATRFVVQYPAEPELVGPVYLKQGARPYADIPPRYAYKSDIDHVVDSLARNLGPTLRPAVDSLMGLGKDLQMRVNFGRLNVRQKKKGLADQFTYPEFEGVMKMYGARGGASLGTQMADIDRAQSAVEYYASLNCKEPPDFRCSLTLKVEDNEVTADVADIYPPYTKLSGLQVSRPRMTQVEDWPRMNWTIVSPDRNFDWNLQVNALDGPSEVPKDLQILIQHVPLLLDEMPNNYWFKFPRLGTMTLGAMGSKITETRLQCSTDLPLSGGQYTSEIRVTKTWKGYDINAAPEVTWGFQFYGLHWDEAINAVSADGRRKDWGPELEHVWPGEGDLEARFGEFLDEVLRLQQNLDVMRPQRA